MHSNVAGPWKENTGRRVNESVSVPVPGTFELAASNAMNLVCLECHEDVS